MDGSPILLRTRERCNCGGTLDLWRENGCDNYHSDYLDRELFFVHPVSSYKSHFENPSTDPDRGSESVRMEDRV
jgi:hypothetical protein